MRTDPAAEHLTAYDATICMVWVLQATDEDVLLWCSVAPEGEVGPVGCLEISDTATLTERLLNHAERVSAKRLLLASKDRPDRPGSPHDVEFTSMIHTSCLAAGIIVERHLLVGRIGYSSIGWPTGPGPFPEMT